MAGRVLQKRTPSCMSRPSWSSQDGSKQAVGPCFGSCEKSTRRFDEGSALLESFGRAHSAASNIFDKGGTGSCHAAGRCAGHNWYMGAYVEDHTSGTCMKDLHLPSIVFAQDNRTPSVAVLCENTRAALVATSYNTYIALHGLIHECLHGQRRPSTFRLHLIIITSLQPRAATAAVPQATRKETIGHKLLLSASEDPSLLARQLPRPTADHVAAQASIRQEKTGIGLKSPFHNHQTLLSHSNPIDTMCVVENKTYIYADQHRETIRKQYRCHNAPAQGLCNYVEERNTEAARVVERRPDSGRPSPTSKTITTAHGREYRYFPLSRRSSKRSSMGKASDSGRQSPTDSLVSSSPPRALSYRTVRPPAPSPPPAPATRRVSFQEPYSMSRQEALDGTAVYSGPPSLAMLRAHFNERHSVDHQSSISSLTNEVDDTEVGPRFSSIKRDRRPSNLDLGITSMGTTSSSHSSPGLSELPRIYRGRPDDLPARNTRRAEGENEAQREVSQDEDERQARLVRETIAATDQRQSARETRYTARKYSEDLSREPSTESKASQRRRTAAILAGESAASARQHEIDRENERKFQAELAQIEREKSAAAERRRREQNQAQPRTLPSARTYSYTPTSPSAPQRQRISARTMTDTSSTLPLTRPSRYGTPIVHQPVPPRDPLAEQGERVIQREQARANEEARRITEMMARSQLYDEAYDEGL